MRRIAATIVLCVLVAPPAIAAADADTLDARDHDEPALVRAEVRVGYGLAVGGGSGRASVRGSPLVLAARAAVAIREEPRMSGYGGLVVETLDRTGIGGDAGVSLEPSPRNRLRAGAVAMVAPYRLYGGEVGGGHCFASGPTHVCLDLDASVFVAGTDLPSGGAALQVLVGLGVGFDAY